MIDISNADNSYILTSAVKKSQTVVGTDHALSVGYRVLLATDSPYALADFRLTKAEYQEYVGLSTAAGCHNVYNNKRLVVISISGHGADGSVIPPLRIVELIVHEVSHLVDCMFQRVAMQVVDTEVRAYHNDWIVGKMLHCFDLFRD